MSSRLGSSLVFKRLLRVALLALVFMISAFLVMYLSLRGRSVEVPEITGKSEAEATEILDDVGLRIKVTGHTPSSRFAADTVSDQSPSPGTLVKTGQLVRVSISMGATPPSPTPTPTPKPTPKPTSPPDELDESPPPARKPTPTPTPSDG